MVEHLVANQITGVRFPLLAQKISFKCYNTRMTKELLVPPEVSHVTETLKNAGFAAYIVGGCTRDLLIGKAPKDWDVATNAHPEEVQKLFLHTFYENDFGTVGVVNDDTSDETLKAIEVTTFREEVGYSDNRRPDEVTFSDTIEDDLKRRDFTVNAIAYDVETKTFIDPYNGQKDIKDKVLTAVGDPVERFNEDALRIMRAVRLSAELGFDVSPETEKGILEVKENLTTIAIERIRDEFSRIVMSDTPSFGLRTLKKLGILELFLPELLEGDGVEQGGVHTLDVFEHLIESLQGAAEKKYPFHVRLAALFHDIGKPASRRVSGETGKKAYTFYGHEVIGSRETKKILVRMQFSNEIIEKVSKLVRWHMFFSDTEQITLTAVRRMIRNVGEDLIEDLMNLRICDRKGMGRPKEEPYRFRKYKSMIEEARRDPVSVGRLEIDGQSIMDVSGETPGPKIGYVLHALLEEVIEDPTKNTKDYLENKAKELITLPIEELKKLGDQGKELKASEEAKELKELRSKFHVK